MEKFLSIFTDMRALHDKYGANTWVANNPEKLKEFLDFRTSFLFEEANETAAAVKAGDAEEIVDGLIDVIVIAAGTLDLFGVDGQKAWDAVFEANMAKEVGVKPSRPNPLNLPDLIKPTMETHGYDWQPPCHANNHGKLKDL